MSNENYQYGFPSNKSLINAFIIIALPWDYDFNRMAVFSNFIENINLSDYDDSPEILESWKDFYKEKSGAKANAFGLRQVEHFFDTLRVEKIRQSDYKYFVPLSVDPYDEFQDYYDQMNIDPGVFITNPSGDERYLIPNDSLILSNYGSYLEKLYFTPKDEEYNFLAYRRGLFTAFAPFKVTVEHLSFLESLKFKLEFEKSMTLKRNGVEYSSKHEMSKDIFSTNEDSVDAINLKLSDNGRKILGPFEAYIINEEISNMNAFCRKYFDKLDSSPHYWRSELVNMALDIKNHINKKYKVEIPAP